MDESKETSDPIRRGVYYARHPSRAPTRSYGTDSANSDATLTSTPHVEGFGELHRIASGGMGVVYKTRQLDLNREVALKMILRVDAADARQLDRFRKEAQAAARLQHTNIVEIYDFGEHNGLPWIAQELLSGGTLTDRLAGELMSAHEAAAMVRALAGATHEAHSRGVIHRDLKPSNVVYTSDGVPKITDFGLAKLVEEDSSLTRTGDIVGTASYMAPEQAAGDGNAIDAAADVYALGAVLYECLTGRPPFKGETQAETLRQVCEQEPESLRHRLGKSFPRDLETICLKCLHKVPQKRYTSAKELADDLDRFLHDEPINARPVGRIERSCYLARRHPAAALALGAIIMAVAILVSAVAIIWLKNESLNRSNQSLKEANEATERERHKLAETLFELAGVTDERDRDGSAIQFYEDAQRTFESLVASAPNNPEYSWALAATLVTLGESYGNFDRYKEAKSTLERAIAILDRLCVRFPSNLSYKGVLAKARNALGGLYDTIGLKLEAEKNLKGALSLQSDLVRLEPEVADHQRHKAKTHCDLGSHYDDCGDSKKAEQHFKLAVSSQKELVARYPDVALYKRDVALTLHELAIVCQGTGRLNDAAKHFQEALDTLEDLPPTFVNSFEHQRDLAKNYHGLGNILGDQKRYDEALGKYAVSLEIRERLEEHYPEALSVILDLGTLHFSIGHVLVRKAEYKDATKSFTRAITLFDKALENAPENAYAKARHIEALRRRALARVREGDHSGAIEDAEVLCNDDSLLQHPRDQGNFLYDLSCVWALASVAARRDGAVKQAEQRAKRAMELLRNSIGQGFRNVSLIRQDADLDGLRNRSDFKDFVQQLDQTK